MVEYKIRNKVNELPLSNVKLGGDIGEENEMLELLRKKNPTLKLFDVHSEEFRAYGEVLYKFDTDSIIKVAEELEMPKEGSIYAPSLDSLEALDTAKKIADEFFGTIPTQIGCCYGHNNTLSALEWHCCSELNIALTPLVLMLAKRSDIKDGRIDSSDVKAFYVSRGTVLDVFSSTLHFCPCEVEKSGFGCIVGLVKGTNLPHEKDVTDKLIFRRNKWLIAHEDNTALIEKGVCPGIYGENYKLEY